MMRYEYEEEEESNNNNVIVSNIGLIATPRLEMK
jgi:hypothetical protein